MDIFKEDLDNEIKKRLEIRRMAVKSDFGFDLTIINYFKFVWLYLTPQAYGKRIEKYIIHKQNLKNISASENNGDAFDLDGNALEIKVSFSNPATKELHIDQIRPYQNKLEFYYYIAVNTDCFEIYHFLVPKDKIIEINEKFGCHAHGIKDMINEKTEYKIIFKVGSKVWNLLMPYLKKVDS
jgi:hypothetical protein